MLRNVNESSRLYWRLRAEADLILGHRLPRDLRRQLRRCVRAEITDQEIDQCLARSRAGHDVATAIVAYVDRVRERLSRRVAS